MTALLSTGSRWLPLALLGAVSLGGAACGDKSDDDTGPVTAEADTDTDTDSDTDSDTDADTDVDTADWSHCPDASTYLGDDSWSADVEAGSNAVYCSAWNEDRTLEGELAALGKMRVMEGSWSLPTTDGTYDFSLPLCVARPDGLPKPEVVGTGSTTVTSSSWSGTTYTYLRGTQDLQESGGGDWSLEHTIVLVSEEGEEAGSLPLNGGPSDEETGAGAAWTLYEAGGSAFDTDALSFEPCSVSWWTRSQHSVTFEGGEVSLDLWMGDNVTNTAPGKFSLAEGTLDGTAFTQEDRFKLVYNPGHHHFERHFAIIFDEPIGDVCALRIEDIDGVDDVITATVSTANCDLSVIESRAVTAETLVEE